VKEVQEYYKIGIKYFMYDTICYSIS